MKIIDIRQLEGPNYFHHKPVLILELELGELSEIPSLEITGFNARLLALLPGLLLHRCSPSIPGGFAQRLERGTYFAHIVEHIALELSELAEIPVGFGKSVYGGRPGFYQVVVRYKCEKGMSYLLRTAVALAEALIQNQTYALEPRIERAKTIVAKSKLGPSTQAIVDAASARGIPWRRLNASNLLQLGYGKKRRFIQATTTCRTSDIAVDIAQDKSLTKEILARAMVPTPSGIKAESEESAVLVAETLGFPLAVKPLDGNQGRGITLNVENVEALKDAYHRAARESECVLIEEYLTGRDFRLLVVDGKMVAASERQPALLIGDGIHTITELIVSENLNPMRGEGHEKPLTKLRIDELTETVLKKQKYLLDSVPALGKTVFLRETANLSTGGTAVDVTDEVHPDIRRLCERATRLVGLDICGVDLIAESISRPASEQRLGIVEVNAGPGIRMHHFPSGGASRDVGAEIIASMYPNGDAGRIPIVSVTGTNGKTTVTRLIAHIIQGVGRTVGMTTSEGVYIGSECIMAGDTTGPASAASILGDPQVEVAVLETARGGIRRRGLAYDWSDVGIITNIQPDHIGQDGIENEEDILKIKSLVAERVRAGGSLVLNADDRWLLTLIEKEKSNTERNLLLFSTRFDNPIIRRHVVTGGRAYVLGRSEMIYEISHNLTLPICRASEVPLTLGGTAEFHVANALAAIAACRALGHSATKIIEGLMSFEPGHDNSGRTNIYRLNQGYLVIDYGHNPDAFRAIGKMTSQWSRRSVTGVIAVPGDRADEIIVDAARAAARAFDRLIVREDLDLRGRAAGEVAQLICEAVRAERPGLSCEVVLDQIEALDHALRRMQKDEVVVFFYDDYDIVREYIKKSGAQTSTLPQLCPLMKHEPSTQHARLGRMAQ